VYLAAKYLVSQKFERQWSICMEMGYQVMVGQLKGMGTRLLSQHVKKGNMMMVTMDMD